MHIEELPCFSHKAAVIPVSLQVAYFRIIHGLAEDPEVSAMEDSNEVPTAHAIDYILKSNRQNLIITYKIKCVDSKNHKTMKGKQFVSLVLIGLL